MINRLMRRLGYRPVDEPLLDNHTKSVMLATEQMLRNLEKRTSYQDRILEEVRRALAEHRVYTLPKWAGETIWSSQIAASTITADRISVGSITMRDGLFVPAEPIQAPE